MKPLNRERNLVVATALVLAMGQAAAALPAHAARPDSVRRDPTGDLNHLFLTPGETRDTWVIPGKKGSLAIGGFVKVIASSDDHNERRDPLNNPELLGSSDSEGRFQINPTLTRWYLDSRTSVENGSIRGYTEFDLANEPGFRIRHAYVELYKDEVGYTAGQSWSTFVDAKAFPGEVSLPNTSGISVKRQGLLRVRRRVAPQLLLAGALEDPNSNDVALSGDARRIHNVPDIHGELTIEKPGTGHLSLAAVLRSLKVAGTGVVDGSELVAGLHASGRLLLQERNQLTGGIVLGNGLGDYVAGLSGTSAGYIDANGNLQSRGTVGGYGSFRWFWNETARSNVFAGFAEADTDPGQSGGTFLGTRYFGGNVLWRVAPGVNIGAEYVYGRRENNNGSTFDNNRFSFVMQLL